MTLEKSDQALQQLVVWERDITRAPQHPFHFEQMFPKLNVFVRCKFGNNHRGYSDVVSDIDASTNRLEVRILTKSIYDACIENDNGSTVRVHKKLCSYALSLLFTDSA